MECQARPSHQFMTQPSDKSYIVCHPVTHTFKTKTSWFVGSPPKNMQCFTMRADGNNDIGSELYAALLAADGPTEHGPQFMCLATGNHRIYTQVLRSFLHEDIATLSCKNLMSYQESGP